jgi:hypothetical protein
MTTPADHGYVQCTRCGTQVPGSRAVRDSTGRAVCFDATWCSEQVKLTGKMEALEQLTVAPEAKA